MMEVTKFLTELAVIDYFFAPKKKSCVGLAALLSAMDGVDDATTLADKLKADEAKLRSLCPLFACSVWMTVFVIC